MPATPSCSGSSSTLPGRRAPALQQLRQGRHVLGDQRRRPRATSTRSDLVSDDIYWFTDPHVCGSSEGGELLAGGTRALTAARMPARRQLRLHRSTACAHSSARTGRKPIWNFIEVGHPFTEDDAPTITRPQIRAAVWHSLIAGARGILYFNHNFGGPCHSQHVLRDSCGAAIRPTVKAINEQITRSRPSSTRRRSSPGGRRAADEGDGEVPGRPVLRLRRPTENTASTATFSIPCVGNATATVLDENRTIPVTSGRSATRSPTATPSTSTASTAARPAA